MLSSTYYMTLNQIENRVKKLFPAAMGGRKNHFLAEWYVGQELVMSAKTSNDGNWYVDDIQNLRLANFEGI